MTPAAGTEAEDIVHPAVDPASGGPALRVLHLSKFYPPHHGGIERYVQLLAQEQARQGMQVAVLAHGSAGSARARRVSRDGAVRLIEARTQADLLYTPVSLAWPVRLAALIRRIRPNVLHLHLPNPWCFLLLALPAARRLPWVLHWHADVPDAAGGLLFRCALPFYRRLERRLLDRAAAIIATSRAYAESSAALAGHRVRVEPIPLAVAPPGHASTSLAWPGSGMRLLAVGRLTYYKGLALLLDAVARTPGCSLLVIGEGEQRAELERRIQALKLGDRVRLCGALDDASLEAAYAGCDVLALASIDRAEAFGLVLLEAMRRGKPCIATRVAGSGMGEVVRNEETGLLVPPGSVEALAAAIARYRDDPALRQAHGQAGRQRWELDYRIGAGANRISALYARLLSPDAAPGRPGPG